jgi:hypothetical protein
MSVGCNAVSSAQVHPAVRSNASLTGPYSFLTNTWLANQSDNPCASLSIANFDGVGNFTVATYQNCAGTVNRYTGSGTYSVAKDGTGAMNVTLSGIFGSATEAIVLDSGGKSFQFVQTSCTYCGSNTDVNAGTAVKMGASTFSNASLKGNYEWMVTKWTNAQDAGAGVALGVMTFDGAGNVKGSWTDVYDGNVNSFTFTGTYSVDSGGDGLIADQSGDTLFVFVVNSANSTGLGARGLQLLTARVYSGTATKQ